MGCLVPPDQSGILQLWEVGMDQFGVELLLFPSITPKVLRNSEHLVGLGILFFFEGE